MIEYVSPNGEVFVKVFPNTEFGMTTIWDADVLIWAACKRPLSSQIRAQKGKKHRPFSWIESWIGRIPAEHGHGSNALRLVPRRHPDGWRPALLRPGVFTITGGRERWLYRVARKHAGGAGEEGFVRQLVEDLPGLTDRSFFRRPNEEIDGHNRTTYPFGQLSHPSVRAVPGGGLRMSSGAERGCFPSSR